MSRGLSVVGIVLAGLPALMLPGAVLHLVQHALAGDPRSALVAAGLFIGAGACKGLVPLFWRVLHHELAHAAAAVAVGVRPTSLHVSGSRGHVCFVQSGSGGWARQFLIAIAPHAISPLTVVLACLAVTMPSTDPAVRAVLAGLSGAAIAAPVLEIHPGQADLQRYGVWPATAAALWLWAAGTALLVRALIDASVHDIGMAYLNGARLGLTAGTLVAHQALAILKELQGV